MTKKDAIDATQFKMRHAFPFPVYSEFIPKGIVGRETEDIIYGLVIEHHLDLIREYVVNVNGLGKL